MARFCTLKKVMHNTPEAGKVTIRFATTTTLNPVEDVREVVFNSTKELAERLDAIENDPEGVFGSELMALFLVGRAFKQDPTLKNATLTDGKTFSLDLTGLQQAVAFT